MYSLRRFATTTQRVASSSQTQRMAFFAPRRVRTYATSTTPTHDGPAVTQTNRAEATMKRFWKDVGIDSRAEGYAVTLDKRPLKTPSGGVMIIPHRKRLLASIIANEWENQATLLQSHALPMTSLTTRALDGLTNQKTKDEVRAALLSYLDTDTICFHEERPKVLVQLQKEHWVPLLAWVRQEFGVKIVTFDSLLGATQPEETKAAFDKELASFDHWRMAAMERATYTTKSFIIALALVRGHLSVEQAALATQVEVNSQIQRWGEVEDTHDVDYHDVRRQLGSAACLVTDL